MKEGFNALNRWDTIIGRWFSRESDEICQYLVYAPTDMTPKEIEDLGKDITDEKGRVACRLTQIGFRSDAKKIKIFFEIEPHYTLATIRKERFCFVYDPMLFETPCYALTKKITETDRFLGTTDAIEEYTHKKTLKHAEEHGVQLWFEETDPPIISTLAAKLVFYHNRHLWEDGEMYY